MYWAIGVYYLVFCDIGVRRLLFCFVYVVCCCGILCVAGLCREGGVLKGVVTHQGESRAHLIFASSYDQNAKSYVKFASP